MTTQDGVILLEALPDRIVAALEVRDRWFKTLPQPPGDGPEFVAADLQAWNPGQTVSVAFLGGDTELHHNIEQATQEITDACNITLDFGFDEQTNAYRRWSESDTEYAADIRVSFDRGGYWSLVGTDSVDPNIVDPFAGIGGAPGTRSLNLGEFDQALPPDWRGTTRHEFMHALSFHHEHQNFRGTCEQEFRWEDDEGYVPTQDPRGMFVDDSHGRRPGIYTYLAGFPNFWSRAKVDHNLRTTNDPDTIMAAFDPASVMLYRFPALFYRSDPSPCAPSGDGQSLSEEDKRGLVLLYGRPPGPEALAAESVAEGIGGYGTMARRAALAEILASGEGPESAGTGNAFSAQALRLLQRR